MSLNYNTKHEVMMTYLSSLFWPAVPVINITTGANRLSSPPMAANPSTLHANPAGTNPPTASSARPKLLYLRHHKCHRRQLRLTDSHVEATVNHKSCTEGAGESEPFNAAITVRIHTDKQKHTSPKTTHTREDSITLLLFRANLTN